MVTRVYVPRFVRSIELLCLEGLSSAVEEAGPDVPVPLENFLPSERRRRYEYIENVKAGMNMPTVLVTYSPGGNIGNLHWIWQILPLRGRQYPP